MEREYHIKSSAPYNGRPYIVPSMSKSSTLNRRPKILFIPLTHSGVIGSIPGYGGYKIGDDVSQSTQTSVDDTRSGIKLGGSWGVDKCFNILSGSGMVYNSIGVLCSTLIQYSYLCQIFS